MVTEMARDEISKELFIMRYPEKIEEHWLNINNDLKAFKNLINQLRALLLFVSTGIAFADIADPIIVAFLIVSNVVSLFWPKLFAKSIVFFGKRLVKT